MLYYPNVDWLNEDFFDNHFGNTADFHECLIYIADFLKIFPGRFSILEIAEVLGITKDRSNALLENLIKIGLLNVNQAGLPILSDRRFEFYPSANDFASEPSDIIELGLEKISSNGWVNIRNECIESSVSKTIQSYIFPIKNPIAIEEISLELGINFIDVVRFSFHFEADKNSLAEKLFKDKTIYFNPIKI